MSTRLRIFWTIEVPFSSVIEPRLTILIPAFFHDIQLKQYPLLNKIEQTTHVPKAYGALAVVVLYFTLVAFNCGAHFLVNVSGFIIPAYWSIGALFTAQKQDDKQVCYKTLFSIFHFSYWASLIGII